MVVVGWVGWVGDQAVALCSPGALLRGELPTTSSLPGDLETPLTLVARRLQALRVVPARGSTTTLHANAWVECKAQ